MKNFQKILVLFGYSLSWLAVWQCIVTFLVKFNNFDNYFAAFNFSLKQTRFWTAPSFLMMKIIGGSNFVGIVILLFLLVAFVIRNKAVPYFCRYNFALALSLYYFYKYIPKSLVWLFKFLDNQFIWFVISVMGVLTLLYALYKSIIKGKEPEIPGLEDLVKSIL